MSENPFRTALAIIFAVVVSIALYHRIQAARSGQRLSRRAEGLFSAVGLRLAGLACWAAVITYLVSPQAMQWSSVPLPNWLRWLGVALAAIDVALIAWTLVSLGKNLTDTVVTRAGATLVTYGPYRYVRHPFYVTVGLLFLSVTLAAANWFIAATALVATAFLTARTRIEEEHLIAKFGDAYRDYQATTGRFWPRFH